VKRRLFILVFLIFLLGSSGEIFGAKTGIKIKKIAVMPFGSLMVDDLSFDFTHLITNRLINDKFIVIPQDVLEGFLVEKRVRRTDFLDRPTIREMGTALGADALMTGSVGMLAGGENPRVAVSAQMIDCVDSAVVWANSVSYTGADFATFLGIGKINSLQKLVEVAVTDLLKGLPAEAGVHDEQARPFEIAQASFFPKVLKGGQRTNVSIEVREIIGRLADIKAFVLDTEVELKTEDARWYTGTFIAPSIEGVYSLRVYATDQGNRLFRMDDLAQLRVDNTPPEVSVSFGQRLISPNNDGIMDNILFFPELLKADVLEGWRVEIADVAGTIVRSEEGTGRLPGGFMWRGKDNRFKRVKDGTYFCQLILEDKAGNRSVSPRETIVVDTTPPEVNLVLAAEDDKGITLELKTTDNSRIGDWDLIIYDRKGNETGKFDGKGDMPTELSCALKRAQEGPNPEKEGFLAYSLEVSDVAGNRLEREKELLKPPEPEVSEGEPSEKKEVWIEDF